MLGGKHSRHHDMDCFVREEMWIGKGMRTERERERERGEWANLAKRRLRSIEAYITFG